MIILISGKSGAGKTSIAQRHFAKNDYQHIEISEVGNAIKKLSGFNGSLRGFVIKKHKLSGRDFIVRSIIQNGLITRKNVVITGIRNQQEIDFVKLRYGDNNVAVIYLSANPLIRLFRVLHRQNKNSPIDFLLDELFSLKWGAKTIMKSSIIVRNNRSFFNTFESLNQIKWNQSQSH